MLASRHAPTPPTNASGGAGTTMEASYARVASMGQAGLGGERASKRLLPPPSASPTHEEHKSQPHEGRTNKRVLGLLNSSGAGASGVGAAAEEVKLPSTSLPSNRRIGAYRSGIIGPRHSASSLSARVPAEPKVPPRPRPKTTLDGGGDGGPPGLGLDNTSSSIPSPAPSSGRPVWAHSYSGAAPTPLPAVPRFAVKESAVAVPSGLARARRPSPLSGVPSPSPAAHPFPTQPHTPTSATASLRGARSGQRSSGGLSHGHNTPTPPPTNAPHSKRTHRPSFNQPAAVDPLPSKDPLSFSGGLDDLSLAPMARAVTLADRAKELKTGAAAYHVQVAIPMLPLAKHGPCRSQYQPPSASASSSNSTSGILSTSSCFSSTSLLSADSRGTAHEEASSTLLSTCSRDSASRSTDQSEATSPTLDFEHSEEEEDEEPHFEEDEGVAQVQDSFDLAHEEETHAHAPAPAPATDVNHTPRPRTPPLAATLASLSALQHAEHPPSPHRSRSPSPEPPFASARALSASGSVTAAPSSLSLPRHRPSISQRPFTPLAPPITSADPTPILSATPAPPVAVPDLPTRRERRAVPGPAKARQAASRKKGTSSGAAPSPAPAASAPASGQAPSAPLCPPPPAAHLPLDDEVSLVYDPILQCYYAPDSNQYYQLHC